MNQTSYVICLKFSIGLFKEFILFGQKLEEQGRKVAYIAAKPYEKMFQDAGYKAQCYFLTQSTDLQSVLKDALKFPVSIFPALKKIFKESPPELIYYYNFHILNIPVNLLVKRLYPDCIRVFYLHRPPGFPRYDYGLKKASLLVIYDMIQGLLVRMCDYIVLPSPNAASFFNKRFPRFKGGVYPVPLLIADANKTMPGSLTRQYFTYVGGVNPTTGLDIFARLVNYTEANKLPYKFFLISSSPEVKKYLQSVNPEASHRLNIVNKEYISDEEINAVIKQSFAVFKLVKVIEQSGIVPVAYMLGTPVIGTDIVGISQDVEHKKNGYLVPQNPQIPDIIQGMRYVTDNINKLSVNVRQCYENIFSEYRWEDYYRWLLEKLNYNYKAKS